MRRRLSLVALLGALVLLVAACGEERTGADTEQAPAEPPAGGDIRDLESKPPVQVPAGEPPEELQVEDIVEGDGDAAAAGDTVTVQYVGVAQSTGQEFDASWDRGEPFEFPLGQGQVIPGWDEGVEGMRVGGRRQLVIPPDLAYGEQGAPPDIGPDETLVFVVDLVDVSSG
jgi:peptidylprolyl isomerase